MADDIAKQSLLTGLLDTHHEPHKKSTFSKGRYRRCRSAPSIDVPFGLAKNDGLPKGPKFFFSNFRPNFTQVALFLVIYLSVGVVCFYLTGHQLNGVKTNGVIDALYFCIVTMTTVGYGDLVPSSTRTKLLSCAFVFSGMAIVALFLSNAADYLVEKQEVLLVRALHRQQTGEVELLKELQTNKVKYKFLMTLIFLLVLILSGTIFLIKVEKLGLVDAFYCVCSTITTLGYGDKSFSTRGGRVFAVFWILASTICLAQFFLYLAEFYTEGRRQMLVKWVLTRRLTVDDLEAADLDDDGAVGAAEFVIYKLKEMGKISQADIALVMTEFEHLDVNQSGRISNSDLLAAAR